VDRQPHKLETGIVARIPDLRWRVMAAVVLAAGLATDVARGDEVGPTAAPSTQPATASASQPTASAPASQPAAERILVRVGDTLTVTQADFEKALEGTDPDLYEHLKDRVLRGLVEQRLFQLYVRDRPDLIPDAELDARIDRDMRIAGIASFDELLRRIKEHGSTLQDYRERLRLALARAALTRQGTDLTEDEATMRKIYETRRPEFDGTTVTARQLMIMVSPTDTAEQRAVKRAKIEKLREELVSGRRTWEQCLAETDPQPRAGSLGEFTRHLMINPFLAEFAFALEPGKISEVHETLLGYHVLEAQSRKPGQRTFESVERNIRLYLAQENYVKAMGEAVGKYKVVGVQGALRPTYVEKKRDDMPMFAPPSAPRPRATRPAGEAATRPAGSRRPATRPARGRPAATRPAANDGPAPGND